jgi:hypothetical protein
VARRNGAGWRLNRNPPDLKPRAAAGVVVGVFTPQDRQDAGEEYPNADGLGDIVVGSELECMHFERVVGQHREHHDRQR